MRAEALIHWATTDRFSLAECEELAKDLDSHDSMTFELVGPTGRLKAKWLDAYYGFFVIEGLEGFQTASQFRYAKDIHCENLAWPDSPQKDAAAITQGEPA